MPSLGIQLMLLVGPTVAVPAPPTLIENIDRVEVSTSDQHHSGFQITFRAGRSGLGGLLDYEVVAHPLLRAGNRVVIIVVVNAIPRVLMDGLITNRQLNPGVGSGTGTFTVTGDDLSVALDRDEVITEHPAQNEMIIALKLIAKYAQYGLIPQVLPPPTVDFPLPVERTPVQRGTDLQYLETLARRFGYVFYLRPGPVPLTSTAYWGPPVRVGLPARALSIQLGPATNVESLDFQYDSRAAVRVEGSVDDRNLNTYLPVMTFVSTRVPPLAAMPALPFDLPNVRKTNLTNSEGLNYAQAFARAQAMTDASMDAVLTASGEVDAAVYGDVLEARGLVGVRGAGYLHDGLYYVKSVSHAISRGQYKQRFTLTREGHGATVPAVLP